MLLAIDVGNTNIVLGVFDGSDADPELAAADAARADRPTSSGCWSTACSRTAGIERVQIRGVILGSVVPPLTGTIVARWSSGTSASSRLVVEPGVNTGMPILYEQPGGGRRRSHRQRRSPRYEQFGKAAGAAADRRATSARRRRSTR